MPLHPGVHVAVHQDHDVLTPGYCCCSSLPDTWSNMTSLQMLSAAANMLTGKIPPTWSRLTGLYTLNIRWVGVQLRLTHAHCPWAAQAAGCCEIPPVLLSFDPTRSCLCPHSAATPALHPAATMASCVGVCHPPWARPSRGPSSPPSMAAAPGKMMVRQPRRVVCVLQQTSTCKLTCLMLVMLA